MQLTQFVSIYQNESCIERQKINAYIRETYICFLFFIARVFFFFYIYSIFFCLSCQQKIQRRIRSESSHSYITMVITRHITSNVYVSVVTDDLHATGVYLHKKTVKRDLSSPYTGHLHLQAPVLMCVQHINIYILQVFCKQLQSSPTMSLNDS